MKTIVCLGDSITCNWEQPSYTDYWQELIDKAGLKYRVINAGINGETAQDGYYRLDRDVMSHKPDLVTIMFGHNDADPARQITPILYANYLRKCINLVVHNTKSQVWLLTPQQVGDSKYEPQYAPYLEMLRTAAEDKKVKLIDLWRVFDTHLLEEIYTYQIQSTYIRSPGKDWLHPNATGHRIIAKELFRQLDSLQKS